jgi:hypothetical protein
LVLLTLLILCPLVLAQPRRPGQPFPPNRPGQPGPIRPGGPSDADTAAGCAACGSAFVFIIILGTVISIATTIVWVFVLIWVAKDARSRGMDNGAMWVILVLFTGVIGLIIYIVSRTQGELKTCRECGNKRLRESRRCPHCRAA